MRKNRKWIGTGGGGLAKFDGHEWTVYDEANSDLPKDFIYSVSIDAGNNKWLGVWKGGIVKFK